jgi:type II secretory pathway pseudopilin PulG
MAKRPEMQENIKKNQNSLGFTILELIIATTVFGIVLLVVTTGIIKIGKNYYKGLIESRTQEVARSIADDVTKTIQLGNTTKVIGAAPPAGASQFCLGTTRYTYLINEKVSSATSIGLTTETVPPNSCAGPATNKTQLLAKNMRILRFSVEPRAGDLQMKTWNVNIRIAYGDDDLLTHYNEDGSANGWSSVNEDTVGNSLCKTGSPSPFCATSQISSLVKKRII